MTLRRAPRPHFPPRSAAPPQLRGDVSPPPAVLQLAVAARLTALADLADVFGRQRQQLRQKEEMARRMGRAIVPELVQIMGDCADQADRVASLLEALRPVDRDAEMPSLELMALDQLLIQGEALATPMIRYAVVWHFRQLQQSTGVSVREVTRASQGLWTPPEAAALWARQQRMGLSGLDPDPAAESRSAESRSPGSLTGPQVSRPAQPDIVQRRNPSVLGASYDEHWAQRVREGRGVVPLVPTQKS